MRRRLPFDGAPAQRGRPVAFPVLDDNAVGPVDVDAVATRQHMVGELALARQPDAAVEHRQFAGPAQREGRLAGSQMPLGSVVTVGCSLRIHHQSPCSED
jgi:hypothetical protein